MFPKEQTMAVQTDLLAVIPTVQTDGALRVIGVNESAARAGVCAGETIRTRSESETNRFCKWYESCTATSRSASYDALGEPWRNIRLPLSSFHGFRTALVRYEYSLAGAFATVQLFRSHEEYLRCAPHITGEADQAARLFAQPLARLRERCTALLHSPDIPREDLAEPLKELLSAIFFSARLLSPFWPEMQKEKRLFSLSSLLNAYFSSVLPHLDAVDCHIEYTAEADADEPYLPLDTGAVFLLLSALLEILNDLSADGCIRVSVSRYGQDGEIRLSTVTARQLPPFSHLSSLSALTPLLPQMEMHFFAADYLSGITDSYIDLLVDAENGHITLSLYLPYEKQTSDFKSPKGAEKDVREALRCLRGIFSVLPSVTEQ